ncbi:MAG TPA: GTP 3',8-cyclase MoaA [Candidatus Polarisedimenticolia bacterium]
MVRDSLDRQLKDLRISVTDRCNFRCPYCMPAGSFGPSYRFLPREELLTFEEIARLTRLFTLLGATKIRLTGGEPLLRDGLPILVNRIHGIEGVRDLALTTNGYLLAELALPLRQAGLGRVTVSLDSLDEEAFGTMNGRAYGPERVLAGIRAAESAGLSPIKINAVVQRGVNEHTLVDLARRFRGTPHIVRFIEYMDVGNINGWRMDHVVPASEIVARLEEAFPLEPIEPNYSGEVALRYRYLDAAGEIGIIASVTRPFCGDCTRARLSTEGKLYTCLFGTEGTDLKGPLRSGATDEELTGLITDAWRRRSDRYSEERTTMTGSPGRKIEMYQIGG